MAIHTLMWIVSPDFEAEDETVRLEREIDETVYKLYGLTKEEIAVVESKVK